MASKHRWKAIWLVLLGAASYGVLSTFVKLGYKQGFSAAEITGSQVLFGFIILWLLSLPKLWQMKGISGGIVLKLIAGGTFTGLTGYFYYQSLQVLDASFAVLLLFQFTWMGMLLDWITERRVPTLFQWIAMALTLLGTVLASGILSGTMDSPGASGIGLGLLAACCYTLFIYFSGKIATHLPALFRSAWMITGAAAIVLILMPPQFLWNGSLGQGLWQWGLLLSVFGMVLPPFLYAKGAPLIETGLAAVLGSVELPVVIVCSALLLHEATHAVQWIGIVLILLGVLVSERKTAVKAKRKNEYTEQIPRK
ncbi:EamA-like transporter family protein [Paenibacillus konkukensis]|uniref:EamA-like transporter family protein n=1 Tax=Paenibacillus konkukensis TaxID=2020716 RepID=A0ABY4RYN2_9BACL|nr:DMT family transporter [Paenibacillus konkukensis]UQZ86950.1 EamA-like transporter family protein [Paenibacillus konkukensis]